MYKIEKGIAVPPLATLHGSKSRYPLSELEPGDSFMVPCIGIPPEKIKSQLIAAISNYRNRHDKSANFATRVYKTGIRCWRI